MKSEARNSKFESKKLIFNDEFRMIEFDVSNSKIEYDN